MGKHRMIFFYLSISLSLLLSFSLSFAQRANGTITGRVIADDGQPVSNAVVAISGIGGRTRAMAGSANIITDDEGNFTASGLDPIPYSISAWAPGYVYAPNDTRYFYIGGSLTITLVRGGVITGRVTNSVGEPVIGVAVRAMRILDEDGRQNTNPRFDFYPWRSTDDRGVYRIYGLIPGSYVVSAGGGNLISSRQNPFTGRAMTYHPSSTRDGATTVKVSSGAEAAGIDISYRGEPGFAISGKILGSPKTDPGPMQMSSTGIHLRTPATGELMATTYINPVSDQNGYAFYGVPNGEYEVLAMNGGMENENTLSTTPRRVTVNGGDLTGIDLTLAPSAMISGTVVIEQSEKSAASETKKCEGHRESSAGEIVINARRLDTGEKPEIILPGFRQGAGVPNDKGEFTIRNLKPGRHRIELQLPDDGWFLKSMSMAGTTTPTTDPRTGIILKSGDKLTGLKLTIASGAASFKGKINTTTLSRSRIHLVPAEVESKDDLLRYFETRAESDGAFTFINLTPGKYLLLARPVPDSETEDNQPPPIAWDAAGRAKIRKEAEAANVVIELKRCQSEERTLEPQN